MKQVLICLLMASGLLACKKDKYTTSPQVKYKSVNPQSTNINVGSPIPFLTFEITDAEGDIGFKANKDTAYIYLTNNLTGRSDSLLFPDLTAAGKSNFKADVTVSLASVLQCRSIPGGALHTDSLYFDFYVKDFAGNKSNVATTGDPVLFTCR
ncbi:MAG: hypothetical protein ABIT96_05505 [Ferruginibacter sp.]